MKRTIIIYAVATAFIFISFTAFSQENNPAATQHLPAWVSEKGYWVVEANIHVPKQYTVRFYTNENKLVATKEINGVVLNMKKRKIKMRLKSMLESSLHDWAITHPAGTNEDLAQKP